MVTVFLFLRLGKMVLIAKKEAAGPTGQAASFSRVALTLRVVLTIDLIERMMIDSVTVPFRVRDRNVTEQAARLTGQVVHTGTGVFHYFLLKRVESFGLPHQPREEDRLAAVVIRSERNTTPKPSAQRRRRKQAWLTSFR
jgi:hypothetical protein